MIKYFDLTHKIADGMPVFGDDPRTNLHKVKTFASDYYNLFRLETCLHAGTHIDIPMHILDNNKYISEYPLEHFCGKGVLLTCIDDPIDTNSISLNSFVTNSILTDAELTDAIVIINTSSYLRFGTSEYFDSYPILSEELAEYLIGKRIKMIGLDTPSPDKSPFEIHKMFLRNNIPIIENLTNLDSLPQNTPFEIFAFPLKIEAEASPVRVVAHAGS